VKTERVLGWAAQRNHADIASSLIQTGALLPLPGSAPRSVKAPPRVSQCFPYILDLEVGISV